jgi:hypothetical protein
VGLPSHQRTADWLASTDGFPPAALALPKASADSIMDG